MVRKRKSRRELGEVLHSYFVPSAGQIPVLLVDTSTIIDLRERAEEFTPSASDAVAEVLYKDLTKDAKYVVFPDGIYEEIKNHHENSRKNGRPEIGKKVFDLVQKHYEGSRELLNEVKEFYNSSEGASDELDGLYNLIRELDMDVHSVGKKKKTRRDPISDNDLDLIHLAVNLAVKSQRVLHERVKEEGDVPKVLRDTYRIAVVSSDSHIYKPINKLIQELEGVSYRDYLAAFNSREYL